MRGFKFGYFGRGYFKNHRVKFNHSKIGFTVFKPILSDVYLMLNRFGWLEGSSLEAGRRVLRRLLRKRGYVFIKIFCFWPVTKKSAHSRMGGGKGSIFKYIYPLMCGKLVYELFDYYSVKVLFRE
jgi:ribosomal protein L16/L10AE